MVQKCRDAREHVAALAKRRPLIVVLMQQGCQGAGRSWSVATEDHGSSVAHLHSSKAQGSLSHAMYTVAGPSIS